MDRISEEFLSFRWSEGGATRNLILRFSVLSSRLARRSPCAGGFSVFLFLKGQGILKRVNFFAHSNGISHSVRNDKFIGVSCHSDGAR